MSLTSLQPVPNLLTRIRSELAAAFDAGKPIRISRAPGRLDVMGGIAEYTGSLCISKTLDCAAAVALQPRADRQLQIFSFNLFDDHLPFTFNISIDHLAQAKANVLQKEFAAPGRTWAAPIAGCLYVLHQQGLLDLLSLAALGMNIAVLSDIPGGAGLDAAGALAVATMMNLVEHFSLRDQVDPVKIAAMCQSVEMTIVGKACGIVEPLSSCSGEEGMLLPVLCQPHEAQPSLKLPLGIRVIGINSNVGRGLSDAAYDQTRCAAFMGHTIIVNKMRQMGQAAGRPLLSDPMRGYLANLDPDDYKRLFRPYLPEQIEGEKFIADFGPTIDIATVVEPKTVYHVLQATDHHVLEAARVRHFAEFISAAGQTPSRSKEQGALLDKAGHLMYASHLSYTNDAKLGTEECDLLVKLVRDREPEGLYGARITDLGRGGSRGGGSGGSTVAVLCDISPRADAAIEAIMTAYQQQTGITPQLFLRSSPGAWAVGTELV